MSIEDYYEHGASLMHEKVASWSVLMGISSMKLGIEWASARVPPTLLSSTAPKRATRASPVP